MKLHNRSINVSLPIWIAISFAIAACTTISRPAQVEPSLQPQVDTAPTSTAVMASESNSLPMETSSSPETVRFEGQLSRGQIFEESIGQNLAFRLEPFEQDWEIWIGNPKQSDQNFAAIVTPPFHGLNSLYIEGWHFRNSDNSGPNEAGEKNVNAPQQERAFCFVLNEEEYQAAYEWLNKQLSSSEAGGQPPVANQNVIEPRAGLLRITQLTLGNLNVGDHAWIESLEFEVELQFTSPCPIFP